METPKILTGSVDEPSKTSFKNCCRACIQFTDCSYKILCRITRKAVRVKGRNEFAEWHVA